MILVTTTKITVDLKQRTFSLEVPSNQMDSVLDRIVLMFTQEMKVDGNDAKPNGSLHPADPERNIKPDESGASNTKSTQESSKKKSKSNIKQKSWETVELPLSADQRADILKFFIEKDPKNQNDAVAVLAYKLKEIIGKATFSGNEIHTALKIVGRPTPRNLSAVFANMRVAGISDYSDQNLVCTSLTDDHVLFHMGKSTSVKESAK
jgi:hypothetical protein